MVEVEGVAVRDCGGFGAWEGEIVVEVVCGESGIKLFICMKDD